MYNKMCDSFISFGGACTAFFGYKNDDFFKIAQFRTFVTVPPCMRNVCVSLNDRIAFVSLPPLFKMIFFLIKSGHRGLFSVSCTVFASMMSFCNDKQTVVGF